MSSEFPALIANHLWQSTVFAVAAGLLTLMFRCNRAPVRYALWLAASLKFLIPFSLVVSLATQWTPTSAPVLARSPLLPVIDQISRPFVRSATAPSPIPAPSHMPALLWSLWFCGVAVNVWGWSRQWRRMCAAARGATPLAIDAPIPVLSTRSGLEPGVFGIRRPVLLLPEGIAQRVTPAQLDAILAHEMCHVRRRDNLFAAVHMLVEALFWFQPLVWWIGNRMVEERERACDEEVLRQCGDPESYAEGILHVCRLYMESPLPCVSGVTGSDLTKRVETIMSQQAIRKLNAGRKILLAAAAAAVVAAPVVIGMGSAPYLRAQTDSAKRAAFEVISIKSAEATRGSLIGYDLNAGGRFHASGLLLSMLIGLAYDVPFQSARVTGIPDWAGGVVYTIDAEAEKDAIPPTLSRKDLFARVRPMLQSMLADRFKLVMRRETKELPVYVLVQGKGAPKLKPADIQEKDCYGPASKADCHNLHGGMGRGMHGTAVDLDDIALFAANWADRPILNRTGLAGLFAIDTEGWSPMMPRPPKTDGSPDPEAETFNDPLRPSLFTVFSQLGLKLEPQKAPIEMYIVVSVERPAAN